LGLPVHRVVQGPGELIFTTLLCLHWGYNVGTNTNVAQNAAFDGNDWHLIGSSCICNEGCGFRPVQATSSNIDTADDFIQPPPEFTSKAKQNKA